MKLSDPTKLSMLAAGVGGAAVAGFGLAAGRDLYKSTKKNAGLLLLLGTALVCPFIGGRGLVRGHDRGFLATFFLTCIGNFLLIALGIAAASAIVFYFIAAGATQSSPATISGAIFIGASATLLMTAAGILVGLFQRPKRLKIFTVARANERFMHDQGFQETNGTDITHYDKSGHALRFLEAHPNRIVFMAVGRRGKRAFIDLDQDGRMTGYTGVQ